MDSDWRPFHTKPTAHPHLQHHNMHLTLTHRRCLVVALTSLIFSSCINHTIGLAFPYRGGCRFFLDTADTKEWEDLLPRGLFHGVTTNPTLLERANEPCTVANLRQLASKALSRTEEFMCQTWGTTTHEMCKNGRTLAEMDPARVVVKCPLTVQGVEAAALLADSGVRICLTACYNSKQALIAGSMGTEYIAPYLGRMTDHGKDGFEQCKEMKRIVDGLGSGTRILVASIRDANTIAALAKEGLNTFTFSPAVARELFDEPLTDAAAEEFQKAAVKGGSKESGSESIS